MTGRTRCLICLGEADARLSWEALLNPWTEPSFLCKACRESLAPIHRIGCRQCGRPSLEEAYADPNRWHSSGKGPDEEELCRDCRNWLREKGNGVVMNRSLFSYNDGMKAIIAAYKYRGDAALAGLFVPGIQKLIQSSGADLVTVIPLAADRLYERGFNQAELLAGDRPLTPLLIRVGVTTGKQSKRGKEDRRRELDGVFSLVSSLPDLNGKTVCIIDDLYTTGSTLYSASALLYKAGAKHVVAVTAVRA
ncbi:ComF family protein [Salisediminibacterium selenitireducens]|uniref:Competence protein F n=1 Tax=Bacillus selenitireducens (strain ATCC 700615 / DSM 15326 / MLS10) TaxID=439292 RepID=D6Y0F2_BACIE|nr:ComF family protein [Salisediminibacterium selenitireducens]ADH98543.1 competence protein F [[Bacillus] selenitireducens MLS10]